MYSVSVPIFAQLLTALAKVLEKGEKHAEATKVEPAFLLQMRLAPNMYSLIRQVQQATHHALRISAALSGTETLEIPNTDASFADLQARIAKAVAHLESLKPEQFEGSDDRVITLSGRTLPGRVLLLTHVFPHFYFHCATAYDILRHCGVVLIKSDFIGTRAEI
jgi:hypothetical protein